MLCSLCLLGQVPVWFQSWLHRCIGKFLARYWLVKPQMLLKFPIFLVEPYKMGQLFFFETRWKPSTNPPNKSPWVLSARGRLWHHALLRPHSGRPHLRLGRQRLWRIGTGRRLGHGPSWPIMAPWVPGTKMTWCIYDGNMILMMTMVYLSWCIYLGVSMMTWCIYKPKRISIAGCLANYLI